MLPVVNYNMTEDKHNEMEFKMPIHKGVEILTSAERLLSAVMGESCDCCLEPATSKYRDHLFCNDCNTMNLDYYIDGPNDDEE